MKQLLLMLGILSGFLARAQDNRITVDGYASREINPSRVVAHISMNDKNCSVEYPSMDAILDHYIEVTRRFNIQPVNNVLLSKTEESGGDRVYTYYKYELIFNNAEDYASFKSALTGEMTDSEYPRYGNNSPYIVTVSDMAYSDMDKAEKELREQAFRNAETKAKHFAELSGKKLGNILVIERSPEMNSNFYLEIMAREMNRNKTSQPKVITASLIITYELLPR